MTSRTFLTKKHPDPSTRQTAQMKFKPATELETKALGDDLPEGYVAGWASTDDLDHYNHIIKAGAFDESIRQKTLTGPRGIKLLIQHDRDRPAGVIKVLETRGGGLWIEAQLDLGITYVNDFYRVAKLNGGFSFSVGFFLIDNEFEWKERADGQEFLHITKAELEEVSGVTFPGNSAAEMTYIKTTPQGSHETIAEFEKALVAEGHAKSRNDAQRLTRVVKANAHLFQPEETPVQAVEDHTEQLKSMDNISQLLKKLSGSMQKS